jgi:hypothetical protein
MILKIDFHRAILFNLSIALLYLLKLCKKMIIIDKQVEKKVVYDIMNLLR